MPQPSTLSHNPLETDVVAPVDSGVMYVDFDDIVTNEDVIDKCERSLSDQRASRGRGRSDASDVDDRDMLDDRVKRDVGKWDLDDMFQPCREYCEERKTGRVTTTVDETDSDSDWEVCDVFVACICRCCNVVHGWAVPTPLLWRGCALTCSC